MTKEEYKNKEEILDAKLIPLIKPHNMQPIEQFKKQPEYIACTEAMQLYADQESAKAVQKRDSEVLSYISGFVNHNRVVLVDFSTIDRFLSTPSVPTEPSIPISEIKELKASCDNCEFEYKSFYDKPCVICNGFDQFLQSKK